MDSPVEFSELVKAKLRVRLTELLQSSNGSPVDPKTLKEQLRQTLKTLPPKDYRTLRLSRIGEEDQFLQTILDDQLAKDPLQIYLADPTISEIMVNGPDEIFVERSGHLERMKEHFNSENHLKEVIERLLDSVGLAVNETNPLCDARLPDGSRMNVITAPLVIGGPVVTIRKRMADWTLPQYMSVGGMSDDVAGFLRACVQSKVNMVISGGTSTGKTTLVTVMSSFIPSHERVIIIENVSELELAGREHCIRLVAKAANLEGRGEIPLRALVKNALRMRPDRIIIGEARGGEALDVVQAMHTGHDGFITVLHANSPQGALERLQMLMLMSGLDVPPSTCQMQIASAVDLLVHMSRFVDGSRRVSAISQVLGVSNGAFVVEDLFAFDTTAFTADGQLHGAFKYTGAQPKFLSKFKANNVEVPAWLTA